MIYQLQIGTQEDSYYWNKKAQWDTTAYYLEWLETNNKF